MKYLPLLLTMVCLLALAACGQPQKPQPAVVATEPTATPVPPTATPLPTATATLAPPTTGTSPTATPPVATSTAFEAVEPCTPAPNSPVDPCTGVSMSVEGAPNTSIVIPDPPVAPGFFLNADGRTRFSIAHIVVRATYLPGTVRCTSGNTFVEPSHMAAVTTLEDYLFIQCFADVRVNE